MLDNLNNLIQSYINSSRFRGKSSIFKSIEIGCSFDPLHFVFNEKGIDPMDALKFIHEELNITNMRLAIRWFDVWTTDKFDFTYYKKYFDYCKENKIKVILNVGPIKAMRWPEEHVPEKLKYLITREETIYLDHSISLMALNYLDELLTHIKDNYSEMIIAIQGDNELFNRFGQFGILLSQEFELEVLQRINKKFPNIPIMINSSGVNDFPLIFKLGEKIENKIILGVNYYYKTEFQHWFFLINKLDNISLRSRTSISPNELKKEAAKRGYSVEISELQGEPWWPNALSPGNNYREFIFTLYRSLYLKPKKQDKIIARYWGIEDFASKFIKKEATNENEKIAELIKEINAL